MCSTDCHSEDKCWYMCACLCLSCFPSEYCYTCYKQKVEANSNFRHAQLEELTYPCGSLWQSVLLHSWARHDVLTLPLMIAHSAMRKYHNLHPYYMKQVYVGIGFPLVILLWSSNMVWTNSLCRVTYQYLEYDVTKRRTTSIVWCSGGP